MTVISMTATGWLKSRVGGRDAGAYVEELLDAGLGGQEPDRPGQETAVGPADSARLG